MKYAQRAAPAPAKGEFILSDGSVDRMGDVIDPAGWVLDNFKKHPIALFNHDRDQVIGKWADVAVRNKQLIGRLELAEAGTSVLVDTIRKLHGQDILRAVSVGFRPLEKEKLNEEASEFFGPFRFKKTELLEASLVSVPANPNAMALSKEMPRDVIAEIFRKPATENSGVHGEPAKSLVPKGTKMNTLASKIQRAESKFTELRDRLALLSGKDDLDAEERVDFRELPNVIDTVEAELNELRAAEKRLVGRVLEERTTSSSFGPAERSTGNGRPLEGEIIPPDRRPFAIPKAKIAPADFMFRAMSAGVRAFGQQLSLDQVLRDYYGNDEATGIVLRTAVNPAMTTVAGYAAELISTVNAAFVDRLVANSIYGPLSGMGARYDLGRNGTMKIPVRTATSKASGVWVGEGAPKPVKKISLVPVTLTPHKLAVITTFTEEMALYSNPAIEGLLSQAMTDDTSEALDGFLIDNVASSTSRPAGLLNGVTPIAASGASTPAAAMTADLKALVGAIIAAGGGRNIAILMNTTQALSLGLVQTTTGDFLFASIDEAGAKFMARIIKSQTVPAGTVIAVDAADFATVTGDAPRFAVSNEATLHEEDTTPLALGSGTQGSGVLAVPMRSLFQTDSIAVRLSLYVTWAMRRANMVQVINGVSW